MSWSIQAVGRCANVIEKLKLDSSRYTCSEPEETIKRDTLELIGTCLGHFPPNYPVKVEAYGSQSSLVVVNQLSLKIEPLWGFVE